MYLAVFLYVRKWKPRVRYLHQIIGGIIVFGGGSISIYFAGYTGEQGGIVAFYFQMIVIVVYILFLALLLAVSRLVHKYE